jgi:hypothetical protein
VQRVTVSPSPARSKDASRSSRENCPRANPSGAKQDVYRAALAKEARKEGRKGGQAGAREMGEKDDGGKKVEG